MKIKKNQQIDKNEEYMESNSLIKKVNNRYKNMKKFLNDWIRSLLFMLKKTWYL